MDAREIKKIVEDFGSWGGNSYRLAVIVAEAMKEACAAKLEAAEMPEAAALIREG